MNTSDFKIARRWNALNRILQVVLSISLVIGLNILASQSGIRYRLNLLPSSRQTLSLETRKQIESAARRAHAVGANADAPWVHIYDTLDAAYSDQKKDSEDSTRMLAESARRLLDDFQFAASKTQPAGWLNIERTDSRRKANLYAELQRKHPEIDDRTAFVVTCKDRTRIISLNDLRARATRDHTGAETGTFNAFRGEDALMSAIIAVTDDRARRVYYTTGHGEMSPADTGPRGLSKFETELRTRNILLRPLDLSKVNEVPTDADLVLLAAPRKAFTKTETEKLRRHMRRPHGRLILLATHGAEMRLQDLCDDWGILVNNALVCDPAATAANGIIIAKQVAQDHDLTRAIATSAANGDGSSLTFAQACPVRRDKHVAPDETLRVTELFAASNSSWGECDYALPPFRYDPHRDIAPPVPLAAVAERAIGRSMGINAAADGRILITGTGDIAANAHLESGANKFFLLNAANWMLDQTEMLNIPPRPMAKFKLNATNSDLESVAWRFTLLPLAAFLLGFLVTFWRRHM